MFKYLSIGIKVAYAMISSYFAWMIKYSRNPNKYPLEMRYTKARQLGIKLINKLRIKLYVTNQEVINKHDIIFYVSNHYSFFDGLMFVALHEKPVRYVGKYELKRIPFIGRAAIATDTVFIQRGNLRQEMNVLKEMRRSLQNKEASWLIFPEGTRNRDHTGKLREFKPGSFKLAMENKIPIVPIATYGNFRPLNKRYHHKQYPVQIAYLDPITSNQYEGKTTLEVAKIVQQMIKEEILKMKQLDEQYLKLK